MFIYLFWETRVSGGRAEREGDRESQAGSAAVSTEPDVGLKPTNHEIMTWAKTKSQMFNLLSLPGSR